MNLHSLARAYLQAGGYQIRRESDGFLDLIHPEARRGQAPHLLVWSDDSALAASRELTGAERAQRDKREQALLAAFKTEMAAASGAVGYYLVPRTRGFSAEFLSQAPTLLGSPAGGGLRVPIQFFDTSYKYKLKGEAGSRSKQARSVVGDLLDKTEKLRRVAQPYLIRRGLGPDDCTPAEGDLVEHLETTLMDPGAIRLRFIDGSAGSGKTVAFNALLNKAFEEFNEAKIAQVQRRRPIAFLPEHIRGEAIGYVDDVIDAAVDADMAQAVQPEQLRWLLKHGFATWMFDGLDEFYAGDNDFFKFLEDELSDPNSQAQFLICTRDSLLSSSDAMRTFIERQLKHAGRVEIYALAPWDAKRWAQMAWLELENGRAGAESSPKVRQFVSALESSATLADLAKLPFYCAVMLETFKKQKKMPKDEFELLQSIVDRMIEREHGKDIFRWQDFVDVDALSDSIEELAAEQDMAAPNDANTRSILAEVLDGEGRGALFELIEALAHDYRRNPDAATVASGLGLDDLRNFYGRTYAATNLGDPEVARLVTVLVQFAFFGQGRRAGSIDFTHHILADYLAARYAARLLSGAAAQEDQAAASGRRPTLSDVTRRVSTFRQAIGTAPLVAGSIFHRYLALDMQRDPKLGSFVHGMRGIDLGRDNVTAALKTLAP